MKQISAMKYAAQCELLFEFNLENAGDYRRKTTFYSDLSIAEWHGQVSVNETYRRVMKEWMNNVEYITEFILCLNWKCWEHHGKGNMELSKLYHDLYYDAVDKFLEHHKDDSKALDYYYRVMD